MKKMKKKKTRMGRNVPEGFISYVVPATTLLSTTNHMPAISSKILNDILSNDEASNRQNRMYSLLKRDGRENNQEEKKTATKRRKERRQVP